MRQEYLLRKSPKTKTNKTIKCQQSLADSGDKISTPSEKYTL